MLRILTRSPFPHVPISRISIRTTQNSTILQKKGQNDLQRAKLFSRLARNIISAVKALGPDPSSNPYLSSALAIAKKAQLPKQNINDALKVQDRKGELKHIVYEARTAGVSFVIEALSGNMNKTAAEIKNHFKKNDGAFTPTKFLFSHLAHLRLTSTQPLDEVVDFILEEMEVEDIYTLDNAVEVKCLVQNTGNIRAVCEKKGYVVEVDTRYEPIESVAMKDQDTFKNIMKALEDQEEVIRIHHDAIEDINEGI